MTVAAAGVRARRWLSPEVVQTSSMDCGPAALKCLLEGFHIRASYGRLREACQTDVDGTSIDTIEAVANQLGIRAEQEMLPADHLFLDDTPVLPALVVVRQADNASHFVVAWRRVGPWLQVMDPVTGRGWVRCEEFLESLFRHQTSVPADDWRDWAGSDRSLFALRERLARLGARPAATAKLLAAAESDPLWFAFGALDAAIRLVQLMVRAGGVKPGGEAAALVEALFTQTCAHPDNVFKVIPPEYWSVSPDLAAVDRNRQYLVIRGAVLLRITGRAGGRLPLGEEEPNGGAALSPELVAALTEKQPRPLRLLWDMLRTDGLLGPSALVGAIAIAAGATVVEALLFRGIFDIGALLSLPSQRLFAAAGLLGFAGLLLAFQVPIVAESLRTGRRLDVRLRMALLRKLPQLSDRYFQSRPISDMAERSHSIHLTRLVPGIGIHFMQSLCELGLTFVGIVILAPAAAPAAIALVVVAIAVPAALQPMVNERDLRVRNQAGALSGFYLDTLLGLMPLRAHRAEPAVRHQHEALLVEWVRSSRRFIRTSILVHGLQAVGCVALAAYLLVEHFVRAAGVTGADLLLIYWTLKLPAAATTLTGLAHQYPMQRNVLLRLMEPLSAPEAMPAQGACVTDASPRHSERSAGPAMLRHEAPHGCAVAIEDGAVLAAGRPILRDIALEVRPGEHVAIVGRSGAGKSSLLGVLLGWHRLASGRLLVDGAELSADALAAFRHEIAWVDPAVQLWNKSLLANVGYSSREPELARISAAVDAADLRGVLRKLPTGLQTQLGEGGALLSGGEGQRVRLGRALVQTGVRLALLDEPFRGMDREQRSRLLGDTRRRWRDTTMLCVTHDVGETLAFDRVLVIEDGRIVEDGAPAALAASRSRYRELLDAERLVREAMWEGEHWRRLTVQQGRVAEAAL